VATYLQYVDWKFVVADAERSVRAMQSGVEQLVGLAGRLDTVPAAGEVVLGEYLASSRKLLNALLVPLLPLVGMLAILFVFVLPDGYAKSFSSGGAIMLVGFALMISVLAAVGSVQIFSQYQVITTGVTDGLMPVVDAVKRGTNSEAVRRAYEITEIVQERAGLGGFLQTVTQQQGSLYLAVFVIQSLLTQIVMAGSKGRARQLNRQTPG
jgi:hypothetical protein